RACPDGLRLRCRRRRRLRLLRHGGRPGLPRRGSRATRAHARSRTHLAVSIDPVLIDDCVHCGFCLPTCPTYGPLWQQEADSPRGRIYLMQGLADGTISATDTVVEHFDRCLGCMACMTACPADVKYGTLIEQTRAYLEAERERPPEGWLLRALVLALFPHPRRLRSALALAPAARFLPMPGWLRPLVSLAPPWGASQVEPPEVTNAEGTSRARVGLLAGCVQSVIFGATNVATTRVLAADGCDVVVPRAQGCCGALHLHAGRVEEGHERAHRVADVFRRAGVDAIVVNAAGCGSHLKDADLDIRVLDVSELLTELRPRAERKPLDLSVAFQDS